MKRKLGILIIIGSSLLGYQKIYKERISPKAINREYKETILKIEEGRSLNSGNLIVKIGEKYGLMSISGEIIKKAQYDEIINLDKNLYLLLKDNKIVAYNLKSDKEFFLEDISIISDGIYKIMKDGKYGVVDKEFNIIVEEASSLKDKNEKILFLNNGIWSFLDNNFSKVEIAGEYEDIDLGVGEYFYFKKNSKWGVMTRDGEKKILEKYDRFINLNNKNLLIGYVGEKSYLINLEKKIEKKINYDNYSRESENSVMVMKDGKIGYINDLGVEIIPLKYDGGFYFSKSRKFIQLKENGIWKLLNLVTLEEKELPYTDIGEYIEGLMVVEKNEKYGYINDEGEIKIPLLYEIAENFKDGIGVVAKTTGYGVIDRMGKEILPMVYDKIEVHEKYIYVTKDNKVGIFHKNGKEILPLNYTKLSLIEDGVLLFERNNNTGIIKFDGEKNGN